MLIFLHDVNHVFGITSSHGVFFIVSVSNIEAIQYMHNLTLEYNYWNFS